MNLHYPFYFVQTLQANFQDLKCLDNISKKVQQKADWREMLV